jgi:hypothetical protein
MSSMRTIFVTAPYGVNVRDVLRSDVFRNMADSGHRIVILSAAYDQPAFVEEFSRPNVHVERLFVHQPSKLEAWMDDLRLTLFEDLSTTIGLKIGPTQKRKLWKRLAVGSVVKGVRQLGRDRTQHLVNWVNHRAFPDRYYAELFARYQPDLVCLTRLFPWSNDYYVLKRALAEKVPSVLLVSSWDNLTSKGVMPGDVDRLVVWNEIMAREARELHGFRDEQIFIGGVPQFDAYMDRPRLPDRAELFRRLGADPNKGLLTFALGFRAMAPHEWEVVELLWEAMKKGQLARECQLVIRTHPRDTPEFPPALRGQPGVFFDVPGQSSVFDDRDPTWDDLRYLGALMWHSDVLINTASTTAIDAAVFDTPVVCAGFDGRATLPYRQSVRRFFDFTHFSKLLSTGGARVATSLEELVAATNAYLLDPSLDRQGRARLVAQQCGPLDGRAGARIGRHVVELAERLGHRRPTSEASPTPPVRRAAGQS